MVIGSFRAIPQVSSGNQKEKGKVLSTVPVRSALTGAVESERGWMEGWLQAWMAPVLDLDGFSLCAMKIFDLA